MTLVHGDESWSARPPRRLHGNPTGAGDAAVAAFARGLLVGVPWSELLRDAVALAGAAVLAPTAGEVGAADHAALPRRSSSNGSRRR